MRAIARKIVAYDRDANIGVFEYPIPLHKWDDALSLVRAYENDPSHLRDYELDANQSGRLLAMIGEAPRRSLVYCLQCERGR